MEMKSPLLIAVILLLCFVCGFQNCSVEWKMVNDPAIFGENVKLTCSHSACHSALRKWTGGPSKALLLNDGISQDYSKYNESLDGNSFSLEIKNFSEEDININYKCHYGFFSYENELSLDMGNFEKHPIKKEQKEDYTLVNGIANVSIYIPEVYPIPSCKAKMNMKNISSNLVKQKKNTFYSVRIYLLTAVPECHHTTLTIDCKFGSKYIRIYRRQIFKDECEDSIAEKARQVSLIITIVACTVIATFAVVFRVKRYLTVLNIIGCEKTNKKNEETADTKYDRENPSEAAAPMLSNGNGDEIFVPPYM